VVRIGRFFLDQPIEVGSIHQLLLIKITKKKKKKNQFFLFKNGKTNIFCSPALINKATIAIVFCIFLNR